MGGSSREQREGWMAPVTLLPRLQEVKTEEGHTHSCVSVLSAPVCSFSGTQAAAADADGEPGQLANPLLLP